MKRTQVVRFPRSSSPFPALCPCCLDVADSRLTLQTTKATEIVVATIYKTTTVDVPYCRACVTHVSWRHDGGLVGSLLWAAVAFVAGAAAVGAVPARPGGSTRRAERPMRADRPRHAHPRKALSLLASSPDALFFSVRNPRYAEQLLLVPGARLDDGTVEDLERKRTFLYVLLLVAGLVGVALAIMEAWTKTGR